MNSNTINFDNPQLSLRGDFTQLRSLTNHGQEAANHLLQQAKARIARATKDDDAADFLCWEAQYILEVEVERYQT